MRPPPVPPCIRFSTLSPMRGSRISPQAFRVPSYALRGYEGQYAQEGGPRMSRVVCETGLVGADDAEAMDPRPLEAAAGAAGGGA